MNIPEHSDDSLLQLLIQPTEDKTIIEANAPQPDLNDFEPEIKPEPTPEIETENKPLTRAACKTSANGIVDLIDGTASLMLPSIYKKRLFGTKQKFNEAKALSRKSRNNIQTVDEVEQALIDKYHDYIDYVDDLPIDGDEKELISKPLADVLFKHQKTASPEMMLVIAVATVYLPKTLPLIF